MTEPRKKPIGPVLKKMEVGEQETFPAARGLSVRSTIAQIQLVSTKRFSTKTTRPFIVVTREN